MAQMLAARPGACFRVSHRKRAVAGLIEELACLCAEGNRL